MVKVDRLTNKELFYAYAKAFGLKACPGLPGGQHVMIDDDGDIAGSFETTKGAYTASKPVFKFRLFREDQWSGRTEDPYIMSSDDSRAMFTRAQVEAAIASGAALHDTQPDRRTKSS